MSRKNKLSGSDDYTHVTEDIQDPEALRRTHSMTVAMLEHAHKIIADAEKEITAQNRRIKTLENLAVTDEMTGLLNRRGFEQSVCQELERIRRKQSGNGVFVLLDLDKFKPINDTYGHYAGDLCIQAVGKCIQSMIRTTDMAGRLGGDEFAFYLTNVDRKTALEKLKKINQKINDISLIWDDDQLIEVHASLGCVMVDSTIKTYKDLYTKADHEMYRIKTLNRDPAVQRDEILNATNIIKFD